MEDSAESGTTVLSYLPLKERFKRQVLNIDKRASDKYLLSLLFLLLLVRKLLTSTSRALQVNRILTGAAEIFFTWAGVNLKLNLTSTALRKDKLYF